MWIASEIVGIKEGRTVKGTRQLEVTLKSTVMTERREGNAKRSDEEGGREAKRGEAEEKGA